MIRKYFFLGIVLVLFTMGSTGCGKSAEKNDAGAVLVSIGVSPLNDSVPAGTSKQFTASGTYTDGTTSDITSLVSWNSSTTSVATINGNGLASAISDGTTTITASSGKISGSGSLTVTQTSITGTVTGRVTNGSQGIANIVVHVCNFKKNNPDTLDCIDAGTASTDANGYYTVSGVPGGNYYVWFDAGMTGCASLWYGNMRTSSNSETILVTSSNITTADAQLVRGGGISGTVMDGGTGVEGVWVQAFDVATGLISSVKSSVTGSYSLNGLTPGTYKVRVDGCIGGYMTSELSTAKAVTISAEQYVAGNDIVISPGATISGTITNGTSGIEGVYVLAVGLDSASQFTYTSSSGAYSIRGLSPGRYQMCFSAYDLGYLPECYDGVAWSPGGAGKIFTVADHVADQQVIPNIDAVLSPGGGISGTVTDGSLGLSRVVVSVFDSAGFVSLATTSYSTGSYYVGGLSTGTYTVCIIAENSGYVSLCDNDPIQVTSPQTTNKDFVLSLGGAISGKVTNGSTGISDIFVNLPGHEGITNVWGDYIVRGLPSGVYNVSFLDYYRGYIYKNVSSVQVTSPDTTTGVNAVLSMGGSISGSVTDGTTGISAINVNVYDMAGTFNTSGSTDLSGSYIVRGLPSGTYQVLFYDYNDRGYITQYYPSSVQVVAPDTSTGIDAVLFTGGGSISGTVTNGASGISGANVIVNDTNGNGYGSAVTNSAGEYIVRGLPSGSYDIFFFATGYPITQSVYGVDVVAPLETSSINAVLTSTAAKPSKGLKMTM